MDPGKPSLTAADILARRKSYANLHLKVKPQITIPEKTLKARNEDEGKSAEESKPKVDQRQRLKIWMEAKRRRDLAALRQKKALATPLKPGVKNAPVFGKTAPSNDFANSRTAPLKPHPIPLMSLQPKIAQKDEASKENEKPKAAPHTNRFTPGKNLDGSGVKNSTGRVPGFVNAPNRQTPAAATTSSKKTHGSLPPGGSARTAPVSDVPRRQISFGAAAPSHAVASSKSAKTPNRLVPAALPAPVSHVPGMSSKKFEDLSPSSKFDHWLKMKGKDSASTVNHLGCVTPGSKRDLMRQFAPAAGSKSAFHRRTVGVVPKSPAATPPTVALNAVDGELSRLLDALKEGKRMEEAAEVLRAREAAGDDQDNALYWLCRAHLALRSEIGEAASTSSLAARCRAAFDVVVDALQREARPGWAVARGAHDLTTTMAKMIKADSRASKDDVTLVCEEVKKLNFEDDVVVDVERVDEAVEAETEEAKGTTEENVVAEEKETARESDDADSPDAASHQRASDDPEAEGTNDEREKPANESNDTFTKDEAEVPKSNETFTKDDQDSSTDGDKIEDESEKKINGTFTKDQDGASDGEGANTNESASPERNQKPTEIEESTGTEENENEVGGKEGSIEASTALWLADAPTETREETEPESDSPQDSTTEESEESSVDCNGETPIKPEPPFEYDLEDISEDNDDDDDDEDDDQSLTDVSRDTDVDMDDSEDKENEVGESNDVTPTNNDDENATSNDADEAEKNRPSKPNGHLSQPYGSSAVRLLVHPSGWSPWSNGAEARGDAAALQSTMTPLKTVVTPVRRSTRLTPRVKTLEEKRRVVEELEMLSPESRAASVLKPNQAILDLSFAQDVPIPDNWEDLV